MFYQCSCCNEFHSQRVRADPATGSPPDGKSGEPSKESEKPDTAADDNDGFSAEDDQKLQDMKRENKTWAVIIAEMGRPKKDLQNRWKKLEKAEGDSKPDEKKEDDDPKGGNGQKGGDGGKKNKEKSEKNSAKEEKAKKAREEGLKRKAEKEGKKEEDAKKDSKAEIPATVVEATKVCETHADRRLLTIRSQHPSMSTTSRNGLQLPRNILTVQAIASHLNRLEISQRLALKQAWCADAGKLDTCTFSTIFQAKLSTITAMFGKVQGVVKSGMTLIGAET